MKSTRHFRTNLLLTLGLAASATAWAQPGFGVRLGETTTLQPEISGSISYDDNVNVRRRALGEGGENLSRSDDDIFTRWQASLSLLHWNDTTRVTGRGWFNTRLYQDNSNLDKDTYGASLGLNWNSHTGRTSLSGLVSMQHAIDRVESNRDDIGIDQSTEEFEDITERVERDDLRANIKLTQQLLERVRGTLGYSITDIQYENSDRYEDRTRHTTTLELDNRLTDKSSAYVRVGLGIDQQDSFKEDGENPFVLFGLRNNTTDKLSTDISVGYEEFSRTPASGIKQENDGVKFEAKATWTANEKTTVRLSARNGYGSVASVGGNSREEISASAALQHQTTRQISQRLTAAWRQDDYLNPITTSIGEIKEEKETIWFTYRLDYATTAPWLFLFGEISYEDGSSNIPGDSYTATQATVGARARY